jgi:hypothetical protein
MVYYTGRGKKKVRHTGTSLSTLFCFGVQLTHDTAKEKGVTVPLGEAADIYSQDENLLH